jgi:hypothetical protein
MNRLGILLLVSLVVGCGDSETPRLAVFGVIDGANGRSGVITFVPVDDSKGPSARAAIEDGAYQFNDQTGPVAGSYRVTIRFANSLESQQNEPTDSGTINVKGVSIPQQELGSLPLDLGEKHSQVVTLRESGTLELDLNLNGTSSP